MKRQTTDWEKILANHISDKVLASRTYKEFSKLNIKKPSNLFKEWAEELNRHFSKEKMLMVNRHMKRCLTSLIIGEIQIKTTMIYDLTPARMTIIKKTANNK